MEYIKEFVASRAPTGGSSVRAVCPVCDGGSDGEASFRMWRLPQQPHRIRYRCYRASCNAYGTVVEVKGARYLLTTPPAPREDNEYGSDLWERLPKTYQNQLYADYEFNDDVLAQEQIQWDPLRDRVVFPLIDTGAVLRSFSESPKWIQVPKDRSLVGVSPQAWKRLTSSKTLQMPVGIVFVEDMISAIKVTTFTDMVGIALLGASIGGKRRIIQDLLSRAHRNNILQIFIALDPDVYPDRFLDLAREIGPFQKTSEPPQLVCLEADPKDTPVSVLQEFFGGNP